MRERERERWWRLYAIKWRKQDKKCKLEKNLASTHSKEELEEKEFKVEDDDDDAKAMAALRYR